jgi:DNA-binding response OmpR family regulator
MADQNKKVVCIEDDPGIIDLVRLILVRRGYQVAGAVNGLEGLKVVEQEKPDVVLLDLMMPGIDGWEVYHQMQASETMKNIPVIIITAKAQNIDKVLALHIAKVDDYLTKPFTPQELIDSIEKVLARNSQSK